MSRPDERIDNLRKAFRLIALERAGAAWSPRAKDTLARDPTTAAIAARLACTVEELLDGIGRPEVFHVVDGNDERWARTEIVTLMDEARERDPHATLTSDRTVDDRLGKKVREELKAIQESLKNKRPT